MPRAKRRVAKAAGSGVLRTHVRDEALTEDQVIKGSYHLVASPVGSGPARREQSRQQRGRNLTTRVGQEAGNPDATDTAAEPSLPVASPGSVSVVITELTYGPRPAQQR